MATVPVHTSAPESPRLYPAAALALIAEVLLLGGVFVLLSHKAAVEPPPPPTMLSLAPPEVPKAPEPPKPAPPTPVTPPRPVPHVVHHETPRPAPPKPAPTPPTPTPTPAPPTPSATPTEPPAAPPTPPAPPPPPAAAAQADPSFESAMRAAIQAALRYPEAARLGGMQGRARVAFVYRDGTVSDIRLVVSSGIGMLDRAALAAVRDANYPRPAPALAGKTLSEQLWVTFNLNDQ